MQAPHGPVADRVTFAGDIHRRGQSPLSFGYGSTRRLRKNRIDCHPEESQAVLSEAKEGSQSLAESATAGILRFAQTEIVQGFFPKPARAATRAAPTSMWNAGAMIEKRLCGA